MLQFERVCTESQKGAIRKTPIWTGHIVKDTKS